MAIGFTLSLGSLALACFLSVASATPSGHRESRSISSEATETRELLKNKLRDLERSHLERASKDTSVGKLYSNEADDPYRGIAADSNHVSSNCRGTVQKLMDALGQMSRLLNHLDDPRVRPHVGDKFESDLYIAKSYLEIFLYQLEVSRQFIALIKRIHF